MTRVLIAFDKFKDALTAPAAGDAVASVLSEIHPDWVIEHSPVTDGGEGFCEILTAAAGGRFARLNVSGPGCDPVPARFGLVSFERVPAIVRVQPGVENQRSKILGLPVAVVEMASASGLA